MSRPSAKLRTAAQAAANNAVSAYIESCEPVDDEDVEEEYDGEREVEIYNEVYCAHLVDAGVDADVANRYAIIDETLRRGIANLTLELRQSDTEELRGFLDILTGDQIRKVLADCARKPDNLKLATRIEAILAPASTRFARQAQIARLCSVAADLSPRALVVELKRLLADAEADLSGAMQE